MKIFLKVLNYFVFLSLGGLMVWWSLKGVAVKFIANIIQDANLIYVIPAVVVILLSHWVRAIRWNLLLNSLKYKPTKVNSFLALMIGYFVNLFVPRLGEVLRCTVLSKYEKIPVHNIVGTVILERTIDFIFLVFITVITFFLQIDLIGNFFKVYFLPKIQNIPFYSYFLILIISAVVIFTLVKLFNKIHFFNKFFNKIKLLLIGVWQGIRTIIHLKNKLHFLLLSCLIWTLYLLGMWIGLKAIDQTSILGFQSALSCLVMGSIGMIVTQGGVGAYPLLIGQTLSWYGVEKNYGVASGWLNWSVQFLVSLLFGLLCWLALPIYNNSIRKNKLQTEYEKDV